MHAAPRTLPKKGYAVCAKSLVTREVTLQPGDYRIIEQGHGADLIEVLQGELIDQTFTVWGSWQVSLRHSGNTPLTLTWRKERSWRTLWLWSHFITASDGTSTVREVIHRSFSRPRL